MKARDVGSSSEAGYLRGRYPYYRIGNGSEPLVVLPGVSDAFEPLGASRTRVLLLERYYFRRFRSAYTIHVLGRPRGLPAGYSTEEMAAEYDRAIDALGFDRVPCLGISMGGMIAQHLAADFDRVSRLVCSASGCRLGDGGERIVRRWRDWAARGDWFDVVCDASRESYTGYRRWLYPPLLRGFRPLVPTPASEADVVTTMEACLSHDATDALAAIDAPTLVIGGKRDRLFPPAVLEATAKGVPECRLEIVPGVGHGGYEERRTAWNGTIEAFLAR